MNRQIFYRLVFNRQIQLELPFTSLSKAMLALIYQMNGSTFDGLCLTEENKNFLFETAKFFLQILMSQITEAQQNLVFCCSKHKDVFKQLLNGIKTYVNHRDDNSLDRSMLDSNEIEDLKILHKLMTLWLTGLKETDNRLKLNISEEEPMATILAKTLNRQEDDVFLSLIDLESDIAEGLVKEFNIHSVLLLDPIDLHEEKHQDLEGRFPLFQYRDNPDFIKFLGECYLRSKSLPCSGFLSTMFYSSIIEPEEIENAYADGQSMIYAVLLKSKLTLSETATIMDSLTQSKEVSFSCLIRTYMSLPLKNIWKELSNISIVNINRVFTSFILYARILKIAYGELNSKNQTATSIQLETIESQIEDLLLELTAHIEKHSFLHDIAKKRRNIKLDQELYKLHTQKKRLENQLGKIIFTLKSAEIFVCQQYGRKNKKTLLEKQPVKQEKTNSTRQKKRHIKTKKQDDRLTTLSSHTDASRNLLDKETPPSVTHYTEETKRCQVILSEEAAPLLNQANALLASIDKTQASLGRKAKKNISEKENTLTSAMQPLQHWQRELKKGNPLQLHQKKVLKRIKTLREAIENTENHIAQQAKTATQITQSRSESQKNKAAVKAESPYTCSQQNQHASLVIDPFSEKTTVGPECEISDDSFAISESEDKRSDDSFVTSESECEISDDSSVTSESECEISDESSVISEPKDIIPFSLFSRPLHETLNTISATESNHLKPYQLFPAAKMTYGH